MLEAHSFEWDDAGAPRAAVRWVSAAGSLANLVLAGVAWVALRRPQLRPEWRLCWALLLALNVLQPFGYLVFSGVLGAGDWAVVFESIRPAWLWRVALPLARGFLYFVIAPRIFVPAFEAFLSGNQPARKKRAATVTLLPYVVGGLTYTVAGALNPYGVVILLGAAISASFGGTVLLALYPVLWARKAASAAGPPLGIPRNIRWWVTAVVLLAPYVAVLGPGIRLGAPRR